jgi:hypothetical protein
LLNQDIITPQLFSLVSFGLLIGFQSTSHKFLVHKGDTTMNDKRILGSVHSCEICDWVTHETGEAFTCVGCETLETEDIGSTAWIQGE